ncbi:Gfo/Idh/MocA family protein [Occallatibacter riparius]|uniref:Gfo/Idh/MocA family oxidoreductase n=1 Tax=Occallatibacter riparius TaxID=1002689 RepID=A0A9J7BPM3_9BACT|nr:Gfo/Idh/MocA family oxidoreductase [Occallatibacter riparius]UWZ82878.1 Gfo/Idh/MocA family oxidoreductase [Occallatibacter riparius]
MAESRKLRMGMVGGGPGAFIGAVHRVAAELDGRIEMVAGAFSSSPEKSKAAGASYRIDPARAYGSYDEMIAKEKQREDGIDFIVIATPNSTHLPIAKAALEAGIPVMSDKPATATYDEVLELEKVVMKAGLPYGLTHTYAGYALVRDARALCAAGEIGPIRKVVVEYLQGWLSDKLEETGQKQASWRADPKISGPGGCIGDIGTHAFHLLEYITGLDVTALQGTLRSVVEGRRVDDDCTALLKLSNGAQGILLASQIAAGEGNGIRIRVYGEKASLHWQQENPNTLLLRRNTGPDETRHASAGYLSADARAVARLPGGHPEGYFEAFAVLYREFADWLEAWRATKAEAPATLPGIRAAVRGMRFIDRAIESNKTGNWVEF